MLEIRGLEQYQAEYENLARALGVTGVTPAVGEIDFLREVTAPGRYGFGMLSPPDVFFVAAVTSILGPRRMLEVGTGSGFSTSIFAKVIALRRAAAGFDGAGIFVHTIDRKEEHVDRDVKNPIGFGIGVIAAELSAHIAVHTSQDSSLARELFLPGELPFAFIDGNHQHPWPLFDVLQVVLLMPGESWILMHDVDLPDAIAAALASGQAVPYPPRFGPKYVFDFWPDEKIRAGNVGAVRVPTRTSSLKKLLARLRQLPSEVSESTWKRRWREIDRLAKRLC